MAVEFENALSRINVYQRTSLCCPRGIRKTNDFAYVFRLSVHNPISSIN